MGPLSAACDETRFGMMRIQPLLRSMLVFLLLLVGQGVTLASATGLTCARKVAPAMVSADARGGAESHLPAAPAAADHESAPVPPALDGVLICAGPANPAMVSPRLAAGDAPAPSLLPRFLPPVRLWADAHFRPPRLS